MGDSGAKSVSELLSAFFDHDMVAKGASYSGFGRAWKSIAGARLGEHSRPADIKHGILIVEAEHQGWMQLLQLQQDRILGEIGRRFPELEIRGVAFKLSHGDFARPEEEKKPERRAPEPSAPARQALGMDDNKTPGESAPPDSRSPRAAETPLPPEIVAMFSRIKKRVKP